MFQVKEYSPFETSPSDANPPKTSPPRPAFLTRILKISPPKSRSQIRSVRFDPSEFVSSQILFSQMI